MVFFHRMREARVVLEPSVFDYIKEVGSDGFRKIPKWGKTISFEAIQLPDGYRYKGKRWRGSKDVSGKEASLLMAHPSYGNDFIAFGEEGGEADIIDSFFEKKSGGTVYCWLTDRDFVNEQGAAGHRTSKQFEEAYQEYMRSTREAFSRGRSG
jgi:hypothetical protein